MEAPLIPVQETGQRVNARSNVRPKSFTRIRSMTALLVIVAVVAIPWATLIPSKHTNHEKAGTMPNIRTNPVNISLNLSGLNRSDLDKAETMNTVWKSFVSGSGLDVKPAERIISKISRGDRKLQQRMMLEGANSFHPDARADIKAVTDAVARLKSTISVSAITGRLKKDTVFANARLKCDKAIANGASSHPPSSTPAAEQQPLQPSVPYKRLTFSEATTHNGAKTADACAAMASYMGFRTSNASETSKVAANLSATDPSEFWWSMPADYCDYCNCTGITVPMPMAGKAEDSSAGAATDVRGTNNQVEGVDEADVVKTDGAFLYILTRDMAHLVIARAFPLSAAAVVSRTPLRSRAIRAVDLLVAGDVAVLFGSAEFVTLPAADRAAHYFSASVAQLWDISDRARPAPIKSVEVEGYINGVARLAGDHVYWAVTTYPQYDDVQPLATAGSAEPAATLPSDAKIAAPGGGGSAPGGGGLTQPTLPWRAPLFRQWAGAAIVAGAGEAAPFHPIAECGEISFVEGLGTGGNAVWTTLLSLAVRPGPGQGAVRSATHVGGGGLVYASPRSVYIAGTNWAYDEAAGAAANESAGERLPAAGQWTAVLQFDFEDGGVEFRRLLTVPGTVLNQYSMDEHEGALRIATTWGWTWDNSSSNNVLTYSLADGARLGALLGLAPGEAIKSARFNAGTAYVVDPLFVVDLRDPRRPALLGELKIPGWSDYLHPINATHIIGLGRDTELRRPDWCDSPDLPGPPGATPAPCEVQVVVGGMRLSLFDVAVPARPAEVWTRTLGESGSYSPAADDPRGFLFHPRTGLLVLPAFLAQRSGDFDGAVVLRLGPAGFALEGTVTHYPPSGTSSPLYGSGTRSIYRAVYMDGTLWTVSDRRILAHSVAVPGAPPAPRAALNTTEPSCHLDLPPVPCYVSGGCDIAVDGIPPPVP